MIKTTKKSKEIIALISAGKTCAEVRKLGYNRHTVRYYWMKINNPLRFEKFIKQLQSYNVNRYQKMVKAKARFNKIK